MSKLLMLAKILLKNGSSDLGKGKKGKTTKTIFMSIILALCFLPMILGFTAFLSNGYDLLAPMKQEGIIIGFTIAIISLTIFFFGFFYVVNAFYFSKDIENLLPLPLAPFEILGAKFLVVLAYEYITEAVFFFPIIIMFGIKSSAGAIYCIYSVIIFLLLPVVPLVVVSLINMIIMRFTNIGKNKERFKLIGGIVGLFAGLGLNIYIQRFAQASMQPEQITKVLISGNNSLAGVTTKIFPGTNLSVNSILYCNSLKGLIYMILFLLVTVLAFTLFLLIGEELYFKGVIGVSEVSSKRKKISSIEMEKVTVQSSVIKAYSIKELKLLFRTSIYFMNCILMNFLLPLIILFSILVQSKSSASFKEIGKFVNLGTYNNTILAGAFAYLIFISTSNAITATAISREGENLYVCKYIPVSYTKQIIGKVIPGIIMSLVGMIMTFIPLIVVFKFRLYLISIILITGILAIFFSNLTGILVDLNFPKLHWDNEQKAVKQNLNVMINMAIGVAAGALLIYSTVKFSLSFTTVIVSIVIIFGFIDVLLFNLLGTYGAKLFSKIES